MANQITSGDAGLKAVLDKARTKFRLAKALGINPQAVSQWKKVPHARVLHLEELYGVSPHIQRPDLYRQPSLRGTLNAPCIPSSDSTAGHSHGSSTNPNRETGVEPRPIPAGAESQSSVDDPDHIASSNLQNEERATARRHVS